MPAKPASAPQSLKASQAADGTGVDVTLTWTAVPGATGYAIYRSMTSGGPFAFPAQFVTSSPTAFYVNKGLAANTTYYYQVTAVNVAGISSPAYVTSTP